MKFFSICLFFLSFHCACVAKPNIIWITAEDMSPTLGCYGDPDANTPNIDTLAKKSIRFTHAFASAPVCSPSRSCLIQGMYPPSLSTQQMRSGFPLPAYMRGFPEILRKSGYYTTNNVKTDYNSGNFEDIIKSSWNENSASAHWRNRKNKDLPFFSVFNLMTSHQSRTMVWPYERFKKEIQSRLSADQIHNPNKISLPPYYPDTPVIRKTVARFHDCVTAMDMEVGEILTQLEKDGLADDTIVFFFSDHGSGMPRHKRALLDSGMHVPLLIHIPEKWKNLTTFKPGTTTDQMVAFVDFAPTVLNLVNAPIPDRMQGTAFLGLQKKAPRSHIFGHRDRVDEVRDLARSVRSKRFLYIRNYMPHLGYNQPTAWPDIGEIRHEFYRLSSKDRMNTSQWHFASPTRPSEELYDCHKDPKNLTNLAGVSEHEDILKQLRKKLNQHLIESRDLGFLPEYEAWKLFENSSGWEVGKSGNPDLQIILRAASKVGMSGEKEFLKKLESKDMLVRYWGVIGLNSITQTIGAKSKKALRKALKDSSPSVRIEAANILMKIGEVKHALPVLIQELEHENLIVVTHAARTIELLGKKAIDAKGAMQKCLKRAYKIRPPDLSPVVVLPGDQDMAMFVGFSCNAFLNRLKN